MTVLKRALILTLLNILTSITRADDEPQCELNLLGQKRIQPYTCVLGGVIISVAYWFQTDTTIMNFDCEGRNVTYPGLVQVEYQRTFRQVYLKTSSCSPSNVITFVNDMFDEPIIDHAQLHFTCKSISTAALHSLKNLRMLILTLDADTTIPIIPINATHSWSSLEELIIQGGNNLRLSEDTDMTRLPADYLSGLKSLVVLHIQDNKNIEIVNADALRGLNELQQLILIYNKVKYIEVGAFSGTPKLKSLNLSYNLLESLPNGLFQSLGQIAEIFLQGNHLQFIDSEVFAQLPSLSFIDISKCTITRLPQNVFTGSSNIVTLKILHNNLASLPSKILSHQSSLKKLYLGHNKLRDPRNFDVFNNLKRLEFLDLSNNKIYKLPKSLFLELSNLREIDLSDNNITSINKEVVRDSREIELTYDNIDTLYFDENPFKLLTKLRTLNLAGNQIVSLDFHNNEDWQWLLHLEHLNISRNQIYYLLTWKFTNTHSTVDVSYNKITSLYLSKYISPTNHGPVPSSTMILTGNPINCDCYSYGLYLRLHGANPPEEPKYVFESYCSSPPHLQGRRLKDISPELLICNRTTEACVESCNSCIVAKSEMVLNCRELPSQDSINFVNGNPDVYSFVLNMDTQPKSLEDRNIYKLNLSDAGIQSLIFTPNDYLKILDVSRNNLTTIPDIFLKGNYTIYLSNNPLKCDCQFVQRIFALNESGLLPDFNDVTCVNEGKVAQININEFCGRSVRLVSIIGWSTIGSFVAIVTVIKLYLNANKIWLSFLKTFCKRRYEKTWNEMRELGREEAKQYDLFISFAHGDTEFVTQTLVPRLETEFSQRVCIHTRDWVVGNVIANQIIESVENSRRTVVILSEHFLMSEWAELEFYTAHTWGIQEGKSRIIIILLKEEVARDERMTKELKSYVITNTYLLWGDPLFWEKLQKILPAKIPKYVW